MQVAVLVIDPTMVRAAMSRSLAIRMVEKTMDVTFGSSTLPHWKGAVSQGSYSVLWRHAEWRCEYAPNTSRISEGTVSIFMGSAVAAQRAIHSLGEMLRVSSVWREIVAGPNADGPRTGTER